MKLLLALAILLGGYYYMLTHVTNIVMQQVQHINHTYQYVATHAEQIAGEQSVGQ